MLHITCNMCTRDLPDMYALSPRACGPRASGIHIRQIPRAHVTTITCTYNSYVLSSKYYDNILRVVHGEDYSSGPYYITLAAGVTHFPFNISILDDEILEEDENFMLSIDPSSLPCSVATGNYNQATVTILEDECK